MNEQNTNWRGKTLEFIADFLFIGFIVVLIILVIGDLLLL
jgi:hypothetical protein